jgi:predicted ATP-grasp superfamily ATP-dependent carboligase
MANASTTNTSRFENEFSEKEGVVTPSHLPSRDSQETCDVLVLNAAARQSLMTARSLGKRGLRIAVALDTSESFAVPAFSSRWCHHKITFPDPTETKEQLLYLQQVLATNQARVVIPTSDSNVALLRQYREQVEPRAGLAIAKEAALAIAVSKEQTLEVARQLKLRVPRGVVLHHVSEVQEALQEIGLPAVVKPEESWIENGEQGIRVACQLVTTLDEARSAVEELTRFGGKVLFQQFLTGKREAVSFLYANGQIYASFAQWAKRTNPPLGGMSVLRQSIAIPVDIGTYAERLVREIELEGYSEVEFRRDSAGYPYLMEINPRLSASVEIAVRAGVDFPHLLYQWASGDPIDKVEGYRTGLWMRYLGGDISTTLASFFQRGRPGVSSPARAIFDFCTTFFLPTRYDYLDWHDPLPAWRAAVGFPRELLYLARKRAADRRRI